MNVDDEGFNRMGEKPQVEELRVNGERYIREKGFRKIVSEDNELIRQDVVREDFAMGGGGKQAREKALVYDEMER